MNRARRYNNSNRIDNRTAALKIINTLREAGYQAYLVGGCVRDKLLGKKHIKEHDIATNARPDELVDIFPKTRKVGAKFGVVLVGIDRHWIEVATFRTDVSYTDGRRPDKITPSTIEEDAKRRDFTINGMYYDPIENKLIDLVGGKADLENRIIRAIGQPNERFREDHLRMLRAVRFVAQLSNWNFTIEEQTRNAIIEHSPYIKAISNERILDELKKMLKSPGRAKGIKLLAELNLLKHIIPEMEELRLQKSEEWLRTLNLLDCLPANVSFEIAISGMFLKLGLIYSNDIKCNNPVRERLKSDALNPSAKLADNILRRLKSSNRIRENVIWLIEFFPYFADARKVTLADIKRAIIYNHYRQLMILMDAAKRSAMIAPDVVDILKSKARNLDKNKVKSESPLLTGEELKTELKLTPGPIFKRILEQVYDAQLNEEITDRQQAIALARKLAENLADEDKFK